jgi:hypothetical protein
MAGGETTMPNNVPDFTRGQQSFTLLKAVGIYFATLIGMLVAISVVMAAIEGGGPGAQNPGNAFTALLLVGALYFGCGIFLNRVVLTRLVEWHEFHNTIQNVSTAKLRQVAFWPLAYPVLFFKLGVTRLL